MDEDGKIYFIEMNTRIQVEHCVTEMVTGIDLVKAQLRIAAGEKLSDIVTKPVAITGHAIECRINAEHPEKFTPSAGKITAFNLPGGNGVRVDTAQYAEGVVPPYYDSLIAKLICHGADREEAMNKMQRALWQFVVQGIHTTIPLHQKIFADEEFRAGKFDTKFMERFLERKCTPVKGGSMSPAAPSRQKTRPHACTSSSTRETLAAQSTSRIDAVRRRSPRRRRHAHPVPRQDGYAAPDPQRRHGLCATPWVTAACVILNDRADLATLANVQRRPRRAIGHRRRRLHGIVVGPDSYVGVSTHTDDQVRAADATTADYIAIGPVFATATKADARPDRRPRRRAPRPCAHLEAPRRHRRHHTRRTPAASSKPARTPSP